MTDVPLKPYLRPHRRRIVLGILLVLVSVAVTVSVPFLLRFAIDELESGETTPLRMTGYAVSFFVASLASGGFSLLMRRVLLHVGYRVEDDIRRDVFAHLTRLGQDFYRRHSTGDLMTRMSSDLMAVREYVGNGLLQVTRVAATFLFVFAVILSIHVRLTLVLLVLIPLTTAVFFVLIRLIRSRYEASQEQFSLLTAFTQESFAGLRTVKGYGLEQRRRAGFRGLNRSFIRRNLALSLVERPLWPLMGFLFGVGVVLLMVVGGPLVVRGELTLGEFVQFYSYLMILQWPMVAMGWTLNLVQRGRTSWQRMAAILGATPAIRESERTDPGLSRLAGPYAFEQVTLEIDGRPILHDITLDIPDGGTLGLTGPTGSGKTQLVCLLARLIDPTTGRVTANGRDLRDYPLSVLRRRIGVAPQEPFLFSDTLAANLGFGLSDPGEEKILWAAEIAHLAGDVADFPGGFDTVVGERGVTLSGGQRQRTAIGRAIAGHPQLLLLDDVFSAIDTQTEAEILRQLLPVLAERTAVVVSHRVATLKHCDTVAVLEGGRITQLGPPDDLLRQPGYLREQEEIQRLEARLEGVSS